MMAMSTPSAVSANSAMRPGLGSVRFFGSFRIVVIIASGVCSYFVLFVGIKTQKTTESIDSFGQREAAPGLNHHRLRHILKDARPSNGFRRCSLVSSPALPMRRAGLRHTPVVPAVITGGDVAVVSLGGFRDKNGSKLLPNVVVEGCPHVPEALTLHCFSVLGGRFDNRHRLKGGFRFFLGRSR